MSMYIFDTNIFIRLKSYYRSRFLTIWERLDALSGGELYSVREVYNEIKDDKSFVTDWVQAHRSIFRDPTQKEFEFVRTIFENRHFQGLIRPGQINQGSRVADPFVIAAAEVYAGTVVTEERFVPNGARIPNICKHYKIPCINMEEFLAAEDLP